MSGLSLRCARCGEHFLTPTGLRRHQGETGPGIYACTCGKSFQNPAALDCHLRGKKKDSGHAALPKPHPCTRCARSFDTPRALRVHCNVAHASEKQQARRAAHQEALRERDDTPQWQLESGETKQILHPNRHENR